MVTEKGVVKMSIDLSSATSVAVLAWVLWCALYIVIAKILFVKGKRKMKLSFTDHEVLEFIFIISSFILLLGPLAVICKSDSQLLVSWFIASTMSLLLPFMPNIGASYYKMRRDHQKRTEVRVE